MMVEKETEGSLDLSKATRNRSCLSNRFLICFGRQHCKLILDHGNLQTKAYPKIWLRLCSSPVSSSDHPLCPTGAETSWNQDTIGRAEFVPRFVKVLGRGIHSSSLEVRSIDPDKVQLPMAGQSAVFERFDDRQVTIVQIGILAH